MGDVSEARKERVFIVDDERMIATTLATILTSAGYAAEAFLNPVEALKAAKSEAPDIVITDVAMPQLNEVDLGIEIKRIYPQCRVLLFAGQASTGHLIEDARSKGYRFEILQKPMHPKDLLDAIRKVPLNAQS